MKYDGHKFVCFEIIYQCLMPANSPFCKSMQKKKSSKLGNHIEWSLDEGSLGKITLIQKN